MNRLDRQARHAIGALVLCLTLLACARTIQAEIFVLNNDGQVRGQLVNKDEQPRRSWIIETPSGGQVMLEAEQVKKVIKQTPTQIKYDQIQGTYPETIEGQWALAEWCRENRLTVERKTHLRNIIALDPNHVAARHGLGYNQVNGEWTTQEEVMTKSGHVLHQGKWRTPQEIELIEQQRKSNLAQLDFAGKLKRWRGWIDAGRFEEAKKNILDVRDPYAVKPLAVALSKETEREVKLLFIEALTQIGEGGALDALTHCAMEDTDEEIRLVALEKLVGAKYPGATATFIQGLKSKDNVAVNRAAIGLGYMKDPAAVGPLIDSLVTVHKFKIVKGQPGQMSSTFGTGAGGSPGGFSFGGGGTEIRSVPFQNEAVLNSLISIAGGANFGYDEHAWKHWYKLQKKPETLNTRRD